MHTCMAAISLSIHVLGIFIQGQRLFRLQYLLHYAYRLALFPGLLTSAFVACSTTLGERPGNKGISR